MTSSRPIEWSELRHAYGEASDIPALLEKVRAFPSEADWQAEPWFSLWSALYHQGSIYSASLAAVPAIVTAMSVAPERASLSFYLLPASIAIADHESPVEVSGEVRQRFRGALATLGAIAKERGHLIADPNVAKAAQAAALIYDGAYQQAGELLDADA